MASLTDWYRYVDRVSRPASRDEETLVEVQAWRPWLETEPRPDAEPVAPVAVDQLPDLSLLLGGGASLPESAAPAREGFEDLTVHDKLPAIPVFGVPELQPPSFALRAPRWGEAAPASREEAPPVEGRSGAVRSAVARIKASPNWELLGRA